MQLSSNIPQEFASHEVLVSAPKIIKADLEEEMAWQNRMRTIFEVQLLSPCF